MDKIKNDGFIDVFRHFNPDVKEKYTRRSYRSGAKERNVGRRLDYFWVSQGILPFITDIAHQEQVEGSDHCPISLGLE